MRTRAPRPEPPRVLDGSGEAAANGRLMQVNVSAGGVPKRPIERTTLRRGGVEGDRQRNLKYHGGPQRAVCLYSLELIEALRGEGHPIAPGTTGENLTLSGVDWSLVTPGSTLTVGDAELRITSYTNPCRTISASFIGGRFGRISPKTNPGWSRVYAEVLREGMVWRDAHVVVS